MLLERYNKSVCYEGYKREVKNKYVIKNGKNKYITKGREYITRKKKYVMRRGIVIGINKRGKRSILRGDGYTYREHPWCPPIGKPNIYIITTRMGGTKNPYGWCRPMRTLSSQ